jgi:hypothetical protein
MAMLLFFLSIEGFTMDNFMSWGAFYSILLAGLGVFSACAHWQAIPTSSRWADVSKTTACVFTHVCYI